MLTILGLILLQTGSPLAVVDDAVWPDQDILHYHIALRLQDSSATIDASASVRYRIAGGGGPLRLDFDTVMTVDSVLAESARDRQTVAWRWGGAGELLVHHWGSPGDTLTATVFYHGRPQDGLIIRPNVHGRFGAFADNWPNRARHWFPAEDHPSDKASASFDVTVPEAWRVVANGILVARRKVGSNRVAWYWREERPIPVHTMVVGAARMAVTELPAAGGVPQSVWTFPEDSAFAVEVPFRRATEMFERLRDLIGPYPYEKLAHVQSSTRFGGMENSSAIFYNERAYANRRMTEGVVAHEIAHQWFGDAVTQYDWHHLWLSEGFASYFGPLFYELAGEDSTFRARMAAGKESYMNSGVVDRPVIDTTQSTLLGLLNANNYSKGAWILHMLRSEVGDAAFFRGVREFYHAFRDSTALTSDFAGVMARHAGRSLDWFFEQWLLQPGYPRLEAGWGYDPSARIVTLHVRQVQPAAWGTFRLRLPVRIVLEHGPSRMVMAVVEGWETVLEFVDLERPARVELDPDAVTLSVARVVERP